MPGGEQGTMTAQEARRASEQDGRLARRSPLSERTEAVVASLVAEGTDETLARRVVLCVIGQRERSLSVTAASETDSPTAA